MRILIEEFVKSLAQLCGEDFMKNIYRQTPTLKTLTWWKPRCESEEQYIPLWLNEYDRRTLLRPAHYTKPIEKDLLISSQE